MVQSIFIFILFLGPLIFFHELGHFFFARFFGVRVEVFSIGFGPKIFKWKRKETEYAISAIPLGGYVKMFGDDPFREQTLSEEEKKVAFNHKTKFARFWIVFGGPLANLILAFILYFSLVMVGEKVPETRFGYVPQSSLLFDMGFRSGDSIREINGKPLVSFDDLNVSESLVEEIKVERQGQIISVKPAYNATSFMELLMEHSAGSLKAPIFVDLQGNAFAVTKTLNVYDPGYSMEEASMGGVDLWLQPIINIQKQDEMPVLDAKSEMIPKFEGEAAFNQWIASKNLYPIDLQVGSIVMQSPADKSGLRQGDIIVELSGNKIKSFEDLRSSVQKVKPEEELEVTFMREGKAKKVKLTPEAKTVDKKTVMTIGVFSAQRIVLPRMRETAPVGVFAGAQLAFSRTVEGVVKTVAGYKKLITKEVGLNNIGGPLAIGKVASDTFNISLSMFFRLMAIISINLGVINLFPIPVLDGGHIMFLGFELINRGPLSRRKLELAQRFGVSFLFLLIFIALFNDISRLIS
ncbi:MAG: RIP metalloprotease RseP [Bacteriovoracaceae bacterium]|nr:RIP metalloprotease RseP [Bacteriovoracaceae bacterium]